MNVDVYAETITDAGSIPAASNLSKGFVMAGWLLLAIEDDLPTVISIYEVWEDARDAGNQFLNENDIPGKFVGDEPPDEDEVLECDSEAFTGSIGLYDMQIPNLTPLDDYDDDDDDESDGF